MENYTADLKCKNCKTTNWIHQIPKGITVEMFVAENKLKCERCGCALYKAADGK